MSTTPYMFGLKARFCVSLPNSHTWCFRYMTLSKLPDLHYHKHRMICIIHSTSILKKCCDKVHSCYKSMICRCFLRRLIIRRFLRFCLDCLSWSVLRNTKRLIVLLCRDRFFVSMLGDIMLSFSSFIIVGEKLFDNFCESSGLLDIFSCRLPAALLKLLAE